VEDGNKVIIPEVEIADENTPLDGEGMGKQVLRAFVKSTDEDPRLKAGMRTRVCPTGHCCW